MPRLTKVPSSIDQVGSECGHYDLEGRTRCQSPLKRQSKVAQGKKNEGSNTSHPLEPIPASRNLVCPPTASDPATMAPRAIIAPSVLASDFGNLTAECKRVMKDGAEWLHMGALPAAVLRPRRATDG